MASTSGSATSAEGHESRSRSTPGDRTVAPGPGLRKKAPQSLSGWQHSDPTAPAARCSRTGPGPRGDHIHQAPDHPCLPQRPGIAVPALCAKWRQAPCSKGPGTRCVSSASHRGALRVTLRGVDRQDPGPPPGPVALLERLHRQVAVMNWAEGQQQKQPAERHPDAEHALASLRPISRIRAGRQLAGPASARSYSGFS